MGNTFTQIYIGQLKWVDKAVKSIYGRGFYSLYMCRESLKRGNKYFESRCMHITPQFKQPMHKISYKTMTKTIKDSVVNTH